MQYQKKASLLEGLIQAALLLSLCGVRVDVELEPGPQSLLLGPTSALTPTHLRNLRNAHPKHPDLDLFFTSRRLLGWVRRLDRLQVPPQELETWLVQQDPSPLPMRLLHTDPDRLILPEEPGDQRWEEPEDIHTQVYRQHVEPEDQDTVDTETETEDWDVQESAGRGQDEDRLSSASLQECLRLLEAFPLTQEQQELDLLDLMEPQVQTAAAEQGGPLMDGYFQHGADSAQELLPLLPSDQLTDPAPSPPLSSGPSSFLLDEAELEELSGGLDDILGDADMLEEMSLLELELEEGGFGEELSERLEEHGYLDPELSRRTSQLSLSRDRSAEEEEEEAHTRQTDVEEELDSDSGLSLDSSHSPASPSHSEASSYTSSSLHLLHLPPHLPFFHKSPSKKNHWTRRS
ncbi:hypothetical protein WMY93_002232 [Mugilogobius chulae]|uniref:Uncharacterized protein n=1 Tax=Mugilogobius chulae TaxID=88201 RepID=A0AAW0PT78_9GOBI